MANNQYVNKVVKGSDTLIDLTADTVSADTLLQGYTAHDASGAIITGTATSGGGSVTQDQDGYIILPSTGGGGGGGGSSDVEVGEYVVTSGEAGTNKFIPFARSHTEPPAVFCVAMDMGGTSFSNYPQGLMMIGGVNFCEALNISTIESKSSSPYHYEGIVTRVLKNSSTSMTTTGMATSTDGATKWSIYAANDGLTMPDSMSVGTYTWIAIWKSW